MSVVARLRELIGMTAWCNAELELIEECLPRLLNVVEAAKEYMETDKFLTPEYGSKLRSALAALDESPESKGEK